MSLLLTNMATATAVAANGTVPLGTAIHGCGRAIRLDGNSIVLRDAGYYYIDVSVSAAVTTAADFTVQLYADGVAVPGAKATAKAGAAGVAVNLEFPWIFKKNCSCEVTKLTLVADSAASVTDVIVSVRR